MSAQAHNELRLQSSLTDESLAHLAPLHRLEELSLKSCAGLQGPGLRHLVGLPNLRRLDLQACIRLTNKGAPVPCNPPLRNIRRLRIHPSSHGIMGL